MFHATDRGAPNWSQDFVEHVRTIHFSLVAVCLALIGLLQFQKPKDVSGAQSQLQEVKAAVDSWDTPDVSGAIRDAIGKSGGLMTPMLNPAVRKFEILHQIFAFSEGGCVWLPSKKEAGRCVSFSDLNNTILKKPKSLADFRDLWDLLEQPVVVAPDLKHVSTKAVLIVSQGAASIATYEPASQSSSGWAILDVRLADQKEQQIIDREFPEMQSQLVYYMDDRGANSRVLIPVPILSKTPIDAQASLVATHPYWKAGSFSSSFPNLNDATSGMQEQSFEAIATHLAGEAAKPKTDSFEVFGVKFPVETASRWGMILVIGIQLYLWIHLYELSPRLKDADAGWDVAWIGVYQSSPAKVLFLASTALLPLLTIGLLAAHALQHPTSAVWGTYITGTVGSAVLSFLIIKGVPRRESGERDSSRDDLIGGRSKPVAESAGTDRASSDHAKNDSGGGLPV